MRNGSRRRLKAEEPELLVRPDEENPASVDSNDNVLMSEFKKGGSFFYRACGIRIADGPLRAKVTSALTWIGACAPACFVHAKL
jgi:hypothetical protein